MNQQNKVIITIIVLAAISLAGYYYMTNDKTPDADKDEAKSETQEIQRNPVAVMETSRGTIKAELRPEDAPKTARNFMDLAGKKFYDGLKFHRVESNFVIQGGDPKGDGTGGSDAKIPLEIKCADGMMNEGRTVTCPVALPHKDGALAMARSMDPNSASSQFYITNGEQSFLDGNYAVFGYVIEGLDVVRNIKQGDEMKKVYIE